MFLLFFEIDLYCYKLTSWHCFYWSHRFLVVVFSLSFVSRYILISFFLHQWSTVYSEMYCEPPCVSVFVAFFFPHCENKSHSVVSNSLLPHGLWSKKFPRPEYYSGQPFPFLGDLSNPGIKPGSLTLQVDFSPAELPEKLKLASNLIALWSEKMLEIISVF